MSEIQLQVLAEMVQLRSETHKTNELISVTVSQLSVVQQIQPQVHTLLKEMESIKKKQELEDKLAEKQRDLKIEFACKVLYTSTSRRETNTYTLKCLTHHLHRKILKPLRPSTQMFHF